jgi:hypothetical protein
MENNNLINQKMDINEEEILRDCIIEMQKEREGRCHHYKNGWLSTSKNVPESGQIFIYVKDGPIIKFSVDGRNNREGIITAVNFLPNSKMYNFSVFTYEYPIMGDDKEVKKYSVSLSYLSDFKFDKFE